jgi:hypothetical protein
MLVRTQSAEPGEGLRVVWRLGEDHTVPIRIEMEQVNENCWRRRVFAHGVLLGRQWGEEVASSEKIALPRACPHRVRSGSRRRRACVSGSR